MFTSSSTIAGIAKERDAAGNLVPGSLQVSSTGLKALGDYLHSKVSSSGSTMRWHEDVRRHFPRARAMSIRMRSSTPTWGIDYLKYDWCNHGTADARETYKTMRDALHAAGRPIVFSLCEWGQNKPWEWAKDVGHLWRTPATSWPAMTACSAGSTVGRSSSTCNTHSCSLPDGQNNGIGQYAGPDHWNVIPDMLEVVQQRPHARRSRAAFQSLVHIAAPLIAGNDVRHMSKEAARHPD